MNGGKTLANLGLDTTLAGPLGGLRATNVLASIELELLNNTPISLEVLRMVKPPLVYNRKTNHQVESGLVVRSIALVLLLKQVRKKR